MATVTYSAQREGGEQIYQLVKVSLHEHRNAPLELAKPALVKSQVKVSFMDIEMCYPFLL